MSDGGGEVSVIIFFCFVVTFSVFTLCFFMIAAHAVIGIRNKWRRLTELWPHG